MIKNRFGSKQIQQQKPSNSTANSSRRRLYKEGDTVTIVSVRPGQSMFSVGQNHQVDIDYEDLIYLKGPYNKVYFYPEQLK